MKRPLASSLIILSLTGVAAATEPGPIPRPTQTQPAQQSPDSSPVRRAQMAGHYRAVTQVYEGVIRGDLAAARDAAFSIWGLAAPSGMPASGTVIAEFVQLQGRRAAQATTLEQAANAAAGMLTLCGDCHTAVNVRVATPDRVRPDVGGLVGHMLAHQEAVEAMAEGLVAPSPSRFRTGAERLEIAPLSRSDLPPDRALTADIRRSETEVHAIGKEARLANDNTARTASFAKLISTCANCHRLHNRVWGPRTPSGG